VSSTISFFAYKTECILKAFTNISSLISIVLIIAIVFIGANEISASESKLYKGITINSSDDNGLSFSIDIDNPEENIFASPGQTERPIGIPVLIAIPSGSTPTITKAVASGAVTLNIENRKYIGGSSPVLAVVSGTSTMRWREIITVEIFPYYQGTYYSHIDIEIRFQGAAEISMDTYPAQEGKLFDRIFEYSVLNYEQAKNWPVAKSRPFTAKVSQDILGTADEWYKISTYGDRIVKITGAELRNAGLELNDLSSDSLHLFNGGGEHLPVNNSEPRPELEEVAIKVYDGGDGIFDASDYFVFFAEGVDRWDYPPADSPEYIQNPYTDINCYWLAISGGFGTSGLRITATDGAPVGTPDTIVTRTEFYVRSEENKMLYINNNNHVEDYFAWYWSDQIKDSFYVSLPNAVLLSPASIKLRSQALDTNGAVGLTVNNMPATKISSQKPEFVFETAFLTPAGLNKFVYSQGSNYNAPPYFDYCEIIYTGNLEPYSNTLDASFKGLFGIAEFVVSDDFSDTPTILDITDPVRPVMVNNFSQSAGEIIFQMSFGAADRARYYMCDASKFYSGAVIERFSEPLLTENLSQTDLIIITPERFVSQLEGYSQYRESQSGIEVKIVALENIIDQFSYGLYDPAAIRDYLRFAYMNFPEPAPGAVLLVGDASYDYEDNLSTGTANYLPPFIHELDNTAADDNYVYFGDYGLLDGDSSYYDGDYGYDMMISRWPVRTSTELGTIIDKVRSYEASTNFGTWRTTITLVADDEYGDGGRYEGLIHTSQTTMLEQDHLPPAFRRNKIYCWEYPFNSERAKPDVNEAIVKSLNEGTLLINYVGHGNPETWAHERIFLKAVEVPQLTNADRLSLFFAASCSIGFFDDPGREGMAEELLRMSAGGAIGVVAATRLVYAGDNGALNRQVFDILFGSDDLSICQSLFIAKTIRQYSSGYITQRLNDRKFTFLGDPMLQLGTPHYDLSFTDYPDMIRALDTHYVAGEVVDRATGNHVHLNGSADIFVHDSELLTKHLGVNDQGQVVDSLIYTKNGPIVYKGSVEITDGYFDFSFMAPLDIGYGGEGARIFAYAVSDEFDGFGLADSIPVSSEITATDDSTGPSIVYSFGDRNNFIPGDRISPGEPLVLALTDSSGINLTGGSGHGITLIIDNIMENVINLTDLFQYDAGSFKSGEIRYENTGLEPGRHSFKIKAWDNANNSSTAEFDFVIAESEQFMITDVLNYPNPMEENTTFSFSLVFPASKVSLEIFTVSGKRIFNFEDNAVPADYHEFYTWDGRDADGDRVATGVYIYKVTAFSMNNDDVVESFGKVVVIN